VERSRGTARSGHRIREEESFWSIKALPEEERPRERILAARDDTAMTDAELLAILLRTGVRGLSTIDLARELLNRFDGLRGLAHASADELCAIHGLGPAKAAQVRAALWLGRRLGHLTAEDTFAADNPGIVARMLEREIADAPREEMHVIWVDAKNRLVGRRRVYEGTVSGLTVKVGELFRDAIRATAVGVVLVHNHPSGDPEPSSEDVALTREVSRAAELLDLKVIDHIILGRGDRAQGPRFVSMRARGFL